MKKLIISILSIAVSTMLIGCGQATPTDKVPDTGRVADPSIGTPAAPVGLNVTYYKLARTEAPIGGWPTKTYTATGYCVQYVSRTYCWDDGIKTVNIPPAFVYNYTFWGFHGTGPSSWNYCHGGCGTDVLTSPTYVNAVLNTNINSNSQSTVSAVLNTGIPKTVSCFDDGSTLSCGDFTIDLNQTAFN